MAVQVPDFGQLAVDQNKYSDAAVDKTNAANRPNQFNALGSNTWGIGHDGRPYQINTLSAPAQGVFDSTMSGQQNLAGQIGAGVNMDGLGEMPKVGGYNQEVINAWNALNAPGLNKSEAAQRNRLAAQGITLGSSISNTSESNLGSIRNDAGNKAILAGYQQGNTEFEQALKARAQQFGERTGVYDRAVAGSGALTSARNSLNPNEWNAKVPTSAVYQPLNAYGAAADTFSGNIANENIGIAKDNQKIQAASNLLGAAGGVNGVGTMAKDLLSSALSGAGRLWNWGTSTGEVNSNPQQLPGDWGPNIADAGDPLSNPQNLPGDWGPPTIPDYNDPLPY